VLLVFFVGDRFSGVPESMSEVAWSGVLASPIMLLWAWWFDHHRVSRI